MSDSDQEETFAALETGRLLFARQWGFLLTVTNVDDLPPPEGPEIAFAGRSNVGKSSLINAVTGQNGLARASNSPGRTRALNLFGCDQARLIIVDMPGYGYASAAKSAIAAWTQLIFDYLRGRPNLRRVMVLIDARHGLKANDLEALDQLDRSAVSYQIILTKTDKVKPADLERIAQETATALSRRPAAYPDIMLTSADTGAGIAELRAVLAEIDAA